MVSKQERQAAHADVILLNLRSTQMPKPYIDDMVMHEVCSLVERTHGPRFYELLDRGIPDWREQKRGLDEYEFG